MAVQCQAQKPTPLPRALRQPWDSTQNLGLILAPILALTGSVAEATLLPTLRLTAWVPSIAEGSYDHLKHSPQN